jgi:hypothetical protein
MDRTIIPSIKLEFNTSPILSCFLYEAFATGILGKQLNAIFNTHIQLYCRWGTGSEEEKERKHNLEFYPRMYLHRYPYIKVLRRTQFNITYGVSSAELRRELCAALYTGKYLHLKCDYFFLPAVQHIRQAHRDHELLIIGFDGSVDKFVICTYDLTRQFSPVMVSALELAKAINSHPEQDSSESRPEREIVCYEIEPLETKHLSLDYDLIKVQMIDYFRSSNYAGGLLASEGMRRIYAEDNSNNPKGVFGLNVYEKLEDYLIHVDPKHWDLRLTRLLWEHKRLMARRIKALVEGRILQDSKLAADWDGLAEKARKFHMLSYCVQETGYRADGMAACAAFQRTRISEFELAERTARWCV